MDQFQCQVLPESALDEAAKVMARAFSNSPAHTYIFRNDEEYRRWALEWVFRRNLSIISSKCPSAIRGVLTDKGGVVCCFLWNPSSYVNISMWEMAKAGLWQMPFLFSLSTTLRMLSVMEEMDQFQEKYLTDEYIMLERMSVHPDYQGQGIGTRCLNSVLEGTTCKVHLTTQGNRNVQFYKRLGFQELGEKDMFQNEKEYEFHCWCMSL